jgi:hypothetical protein
MPHPLYGLTHLGRPLEPRYPTNLAALLLMGAALIAGALQAWLGGAGARAAGGMGAVAMAAVFFTWALGREVAPDDNPAAFVAVAIAAAAWIAFGAPDLWLLAAAVGLVRVVARTIGKPCKISDTAILLCAAIALTLGLDQTAVGIGAALALFLDGVLVEPLRRHLWLAPVPLAAVAVQLLRRGVTFASPLPGWALALAAAAAALAIASQPAPVSRCDLRQEPPPRRRVQAGIAVILVVTLWATLTRDGLAVAAPLWAALAAVAISRLRPRKD